ncbi:MAG: hypothetical protein AAGD07_22470 [Planctomycetota bacterium]
MKWIKSDDAFQLLANAVVIAEVIREDSGSWKWHRYTTMAEHGTPPGHGRTDSRKKAQKAVTQGMTA